VEAATNDPRCRPETCGSMPRAGHVLHGKIRAGTTTGDADQIAAPTHDSVLNNDLLIDNDADRWNVRIITPRAGIRTTFGDNQVCCSRLHNARCG
jgi:hypothetical protein